ncbi:glucokinase [Candidatus Woesearchaeota archaeon]|nr:glucokinase [Candidatus Woesearchaeota archaeon]
MSILAGDIGATKTILAIHDEHGLQAKRRFASKDYPSFDELLKEFIGKHDVTSACFGAPGPVINGVVKTTNLRWTLDARKLARTLGCPVGLINDVEAMAFGLPQLLPHDAALAVGKRHTGNATKALLAPGTGLGMAFLHWTGTHHDVIASEGGHADFAPRTALEWELKTHLRKTLGYAGTEAVLSGPGLRNIYDFLKHRQFARQDPQMREALRTQGARAITEGAYRNDPLCKGAIELFTHALMHETQRVALTGKALGGVYLAGGVVRHLVPFIRTSAFAKHYHDNRRMRRLLELIPVHLVLNDELGLLGALKFARTRVR